MEDPLQSGAALQYSEKPYPRPMRITCFVLLAIPVAIFAAATYISIGYTNRNIAADRAFTSIAFMFPREQTALDAFRRIGLAPGHWGTPPQDYYILWRRPSAPGDRLVDLYYQFTDRGSRRLIATVYFDPSNPTSTDREMTSYTRQLERFKVYSRTTPLTPLDETTSTADSPPANH